MVLHGRRLWLLVVLCLGFFNLGFGPPAVLDAPEGSLPVYASQVPAIKRARLPTVGAEAFAVVDGQTGELLAGQNPHKRLAQASTTKITTAIVALERGRLDDTVRIDVDSRQMTDSSVMGLIPGDRVTLRDLLYGLLLPSGNDAALAIARHIAGDETKFVALMNAEAQALGLQDTHYANPHGLDAPDHFSSAYDLDVLARYAMRNPTFATIVKTPSYTAHGANNDYQMVNTNGLLGRYQGLDGVKTGFTDNALQALVSTAVRNDRRVFVTVLRSTDRLADSVPLLDYYFANYVDRTFDLPRSALNAFADKDGPTVFVGPRPVPQLSLKAWEARYVHPFVWLDEGATSAPAADAQLGYVGFYIGERLLVEAPVYAR